MCSLCTCMVSLLLDGFVARSSARRDGRINNIISLSKNSYSTMYLHVHLKTLKSCGNQLHIYTSRGHRVTLSCIRRTYLCPHNEF